MEKKIQTAFLLQPLASSTRFRLRLGLSRKWLVADAEVGLTWQGRKGTDGRESNGDMPLFSVSELCPSLFDQLLYFSPTQSSWMRCGLNALETESIWVMMTEHGQQQAFCYATPLYCSFGGGTQAPAPPFHFGLRLTSGEYCKRASCYLEACL